MRDKRTPLEFLREDAGAKQSRAFQLTDRAFQRFKAVAKRQGYGGLIGPYMVRLGLEQGETHLTPDELHRADAAADEETRRRIRPRMLAAGYTKAEIDEALQSEEFRSLL